MGSRRGGGGMAPHYMGGGVRNYMRPQGDQQFGAVGYNEPARPDGSAGMNYTRPVGAPSAIPGGANYAMPTGAPQLPQSPLFTGGRTVQDLLSSAAHGGTITPGQLMPMVDSRNVQGMNAQDIMANFGGYQDPVTKTIGLPEIVNTLGTGRYWAGDHYVNLPDAPAGQGGDMMVNPFLRR